MWTLDSGVFCHILPHLDNKTIIFLLSAFGNIIKEAISLPNYWHNKTEILLTKNLEFRKVDWGKIYPIIKPFSNNLGGLLGSYVLYKHTDETNLIESIKILNEAKYDLESTIINLFRNLVTAGNLKTMEFLLTNYEHPKEIINMIQSQIVRTRCVDYSKIKKFLSFLVNKNLITIKDLHFKKHIMWSNTSLVKVLITDFDFDPTIRNDSLLISSAECNNVELIKILLADGRSNPAARNNLALFKSSVNGNINTVKLLFQDPRTKPSNGCEKECIFATARERRTDTLYFLLNNSKLINFTNKELINWAINKGFDIMMNLILHNKNLIIDYILKSFKHYDGLKYFLQSFGGLFNGITSGDINKIIIVCHLIYLSQNILGNPGISSFGVNSDKLVLNFRRSARLNTNITVFIKYAETNGKINGYIHRIYNSKYFQPSKSKGLTCFKNTGF
jgi:hypothetical protein